MGNIVSLTKQLYTPAKIKLENAKEEGLTRLLNDWGKLNETTTLNTSTIMMAIERADYLQPYLDIKYNKKNRKKKSIVWSEYHKDCAYLRLYFISELIKLGHSKYINICNKNGNTPLIFACALREPKLVKLLLDNGSTIMELNTCTAPIEICPRCIESKSICKYHEYLNNMKYNMINYCNKVKNDYRNLALLTVQKIPSRFFAHKANVMTEIVDILENELNTRQQILFKSFEKLQIIQLPKDLIPLIVSFIPI